MATKKYVSDTKLQYFWNKIKTYITNAISGKQDTLTAGTNITIANNVISANDEIMIITLTRSDNIITANKTYTEILNCVANGGIPLIIEDTGVYYLTQGDANGVGFYRTCIKENKIWNDGYFISNTNDVDFIESVYPTEAEMEEMLQEMGFINPLISNYDNAIYLEQYAQ